MNGGDSSSGAESSIFEWNKSAVAIMGGIVTIIVCCIVINIGHYIARKKLADRDFFKEYLEEDTTRAHMKDIIVKVGRGCDTGGDQLVSVLLSCFFGHCT